MAKVLEFPRQRRKFQRVELAQAVALVHENATVATALTRNISAGGVQLLCNRLTVDSLHTGGPLQSQTVLPRLDAHLRLPVNYGLVKLDLECAMSYVTEFDADAFAVGLEFVSMTAASSHGLSRFLCEAETYNLLDG